MKNIWIILLCAGLVLLALFFVFRKPQKTASPSMMSLVEKQMAFGPRTPNSQAHADFIAWASQYFTEHHWKVSAKASKYQGHEVINITAERFAQDPDAEWILLGAHYDCRMLADQETDAANQTKAVPGANDGASGVAVLMGLAAFLPEDLNKNITLALFDAEDQGNIPGWDWCLGAKLMAEQLAEQERKPDAVIVVDMIGDADLQIYREQRSDDKLTDEIWETAARNGYGGQFINRDKYAMEDDHIPFQQIGIPAVDLIDFDYPYWHTRKDTADKVSEESLEAVRQVLFTWLKEQ